MLIAECVLCPVNEQRENERGHCSDKSDSYRYYQAPRFLAKMTLGKKDTEGHPGDRSPKNAGKYDEAYY
jgi:hypothetical protein